MAKNVKKLSLANKLAKKGDVITPTEIISKQNPVGNLKVSGNQYVFYPLFILFLIIKGYRGSGESIVLYVFILLAHSNSKAAKFKWRASKDYKY